MPQNDQNPFSPLTSASPDELAGLLEGEEDFLAGLVLSRLPHTLVGKILSRLGADRQRHLARIMMEKRTVPPGVMQTVADNLIQRLQKSPSSGRPGTSKIQTAHARPQPSSPPAASPSSSAKRPPQRSRVYASGHSDGPGHPSSPPAPLSSPPDDEAGKADAIRRTLEAVQRKRGEAPSIPSSGTYSYGGPDLAAEILRYANQDVRNLVAEHEPILYRTLRKRMFVFDDLELTSEKALGEIFMAVEPRTAALSLRFASEELQARAIGALPGRKAKQIQDEVKQSRSERVRVRDIETAQEEVIRIAKRLQETGRIVIDPNDPDLL